MSDEVERATSGELSVHVEDGLCPMCSRANGEHETWCELQPIFYARCRNQIEMDVIDAIIAAVALLEAEPEPEYPPPHISSFDRIKLHMGFASQYRLPEDVPTRWEYVAALAIRELMRQKGET